METIRQVGPLEVPVLVQGESGAGKELVARGIHACSRRKDAPFVTVNCAAISPQLIESELFGHVRGSFTGATSDKMGLIETANKGTLFLDEIGEMSLELQPKLLRMLDSGETMRVGETKPRFADVRVIAATNRDPHEMIQAGEFREDLFFRIRGFTIALPPLRGRGADVLVLTEHFLRKHCPPGRAPLKLAPDMRRVLLAYGWPGNIRELRNLCAALYATPTEELPTVAHAARLLGIELDREAQDAFVPYKDFKKAELARLEAEYFTRLLRAFQGNIAKASAAAGMYPANLRSKLRRCGVDPAAFRKQAPQSKQDAADAPAQSDISPRKSF